MAGGRSTAAADAGLNAGLNSGLNADLNAGLVAGVDAGTGVHPGANVDLSDLVIRPPTHADLEAVVQLFATAAAARPGNSPPLRRDDLRVRWLMLDHLEDAVLVLRTGTDDTEDNRAAPRLLAYASAPVDVEVDPETGTCEAVVHLEGEVHPDHRGRGLGSFLLDRAVVTGRAALTAAATSQAHSDSAAGVTGPTPGTHHGGAAATSDPTPAAHAPGHVRVRTALVDATPDEHAWFHSRGFDPVRHLLELRLDLHAPPPAPRWPEGVRVRTFQPGADEDVLWRTHRAAFADVPTHLPIEREDFLRDRAPGDDPGLVLLAEHGHPTAEVVAIAVCRAGTEFAAEEGLVRDLGVVPPWRRRGVAMALLRTAFATFRARGLTGVALEVDDVTLDGAVALYRRAGMRVTRRTDVLERTTSMQISLPGSTRSG